VWRSFRAIKGLLALSTALALAIASPGADAGAAATSARRLSFLSVKGKRIVDENGKGVFLRGFHYNCFVHFRPGAGTAAPCGNAEANLRLAKHWFSDFDVREFQESGANVVRIGLRLWEMEDSPGNRREDSFRQLDDIVSRWGNKGVYVILDLHVAGQNRFEWNEYGNVIWEDDSFRERVISLWVEIAARYRDNPFIAGYDVINEPQAPTKRALHEFYERLIGRIRGVDGRHMIILEWDQKNKKAFSVGGRYGDPNIVYSFHLYEPGQFANQGVQGRRTGFRYPARYGGTYWDRSQIDKYVSDVLSVLDDRPVFVGEFGVNHLAGGPDAIRWVDDVTAVLNRHGIHYTYFVYKWATRADFGYYMPTEGAYGTMMSMTGDMRRKRIDLSDVKEENLRVLRTEGHFETSPDLKRVLTNAFSRGNDAPAR
jgi:endoglucanase